MFRATYLLNRGGLCSPWMSLLPSVRSEVRSGVTRVGWAWLSTFMVTVLAYGSPGARAEEPSAVIRGNIFIGEHTRSTPVGDVTVFKTFGRDRRLDFVTIVPAPVDDVWHALTTVAGIQSFYAPEATVDLRPGRAYEIREDRSAPLPKGVEGTKVLSFVPKEMLSVTGSAPFPFPTVQEKKTRWVFLLDPVNEGTRVQLSMIEWPVGDEWDEAFEYFTNHSQVFLESLYKRFAEGPVDWNAKRITISRPVRKHRNPNEKLWRVDKSVLVEGRPDTIWRQFTTDDGLKKWASPGANVELRFGGVYERLSNPTAPKGRRGQEGTHILCYVPQELLSYTWLAPIQFPEVRKGPAWETWRFTQPSPGWVRIHYTALGIGAGKQWQDAFNLLDRRMDVMMGNLRAYLEH